MLSSEEEESLLEEPCHHSLQIANHNTNGDEEEEEKLKQEPSGIACAIPNHTIAGITCAGCGGCGQGHGKAVAAGYKAVVLEEELVVVCIFPQSKFTNSLFSLSFFSPCDERNGPGLFNSNCSTFVTKSITNCCIAISSRNLINALLLLGILTFL